MSTNADGVATTGREVHWAEAYCTQCYWHHMPSTGNLLSNARNAAHDHIAKEGHKVEVTVQKMYTYGPQSDLKGG